MRSWVKTVVPAAAGLAMAASMLVGPSAAVQAAPLVPLASTVVPAPVDASTDPGSVLRVNPVAYGTGGSLFVDFKAAAVKNRKVQFQRWTGTEWVSVGALIKMKSSGVAILKTTPDVEAAYRALAVQITYKRKVRLATPSNIASSPLSAVKNYGFDVDGALDADWATRNDGRFDAYGRVCSAPHAANSVVSGGKVTLAVSKIASPSAEVKSGCAKGIMATRSYSKKQKKALIKKNPVYWNAMLGTQDSFMMKTGIVAARIKFPKNTGMHSGVWLQSGVRSEIDMVESYGYGKGITNVVHVNGKENKLYKAKMKSKSWWSKYHVFSVEWTRNTLGLTKLVFRIDGAVTKSKSLWTPDANYFLVMSNLSSDWELSKIKDSQLKSAKMSVDWVKVWSTPAP